MNNGTLVTKEFRVHDLGGKVSKDFSPAPGLQEGLVLQSS